MTKEWLKGREGRNLQFKRETLLNYGMNRWGLNKAASVGPTSELIRECSPKSFEDWETFYFKNAVQKKVGGINITRDYLEDRGRTLYIKLSEVVQNELASINEEECIDYVFNLVLNRTYEGYIGEIQTIYGQLEKNLGLKINPAPDKWDRLYNVDFYVEINGKYIGLQIKPVTFKHFVEEYKWEEMLKATHIKFEKAFGAKVFIIFSIKSGERKIIKNPEIIAEIEREIQRLKSQ